PHRQRQCSGPTAGPADRSGPAGRVRHTGVESRDAEGRPMTTTEARIQHLPTPPGPKLPGALQTFLFPYRHLVMPRLRKRYGDVVAIELLGRPSVLLYTPELNKIVFSGSPEVFHAGEG